MENTNNIMLMLNKIESSLNELTRRVGELEGRQNITQPMGVNPYCNTTPYVNPTNILNPIEMQLLQRINSRRPQSNPQYNPQYRPQYVVSKSIEELNSIKLHMLNHVTNCTKQGLSANDDGVFDKIDAIERILIQGLVNLQHNYNMYPNNDSDLMMISNAVSNIYSKHRFNSLFNNKTIPTITQADITNIIALKQDIEVLVSNWNIKTVNNSDVNNSYTVKSVYSSNKAVQHSDRPVSRIIDIIVDTLTNRHNKTLTIFEKNALDKIKSLDSIPLDIYNHVNSLHLHVTQSVCIPEIFTSLLTSITDMMYDRGYMKDFVNEKGTVNVKPMNSVENIKWVDQDSNIKKPTNDNVNINELDIIKTIENATDKLLILPLYTSDSELNKCVKLLNDYLTLNRSQLYMAKEITVKHVSCNYLANELLNILNSYNVPTEYVHGKYINNLDKLIVDLRELIKDYDYNIINTLNPTKAPVTNKPKKRQVRRR